MKKKIFAALAAVVTGLCCLAAPVSAESQYRMGDVNRDGQIGLADAQLALKEYAHRIVGLVYLDDEQRELAKVFDRSLLQDAEKDNIQLADVQIILRYHTFSLGQYPEVKELDVVEFGKKLRAGEFGH